MPPLIEDDGYGSDDLDTIPAKPSKKSAKLASPAIEEDEEGEEEVEATNGANGKDDDEEDGEEFAVERILEHAIEKGTVIYKVKWLGYDDEADQTWEPAVNLEEGAADILEEYHNGIGGKPEVKPKGGRGKRKSAATESPAPPPAKKGKKSAKSEGEQEWTPPVGSWEDEVDEILTINDVPLEGKAGAKQTGGNTLNIFLRFKDGHRTAFSLATARQKCPQRLLDYYEQHLTFKEQAPETL